MSNIFNKLFSYYGEQLEKIENEFDRLERVSTRLSNLYKLLNDDDDEMDELYDLMEVEDLQHDEDLENLKTKLDQVERSFVVLQSFYKKNEDNPKFKKLTKGTIKKNKIFETKKKQHEFFKEFEEDIDNSECYGIFYENDDEEANEIFHQ